MPVRVGVGTEDGVAFGVVRVDDGDVTGARAMGVNVEWVAVLVDQVREAPGGVGEVIFVQDTDARLDQPGDRRVERGVASRSARTRART